MSESAKAGYYPTCPEHLGHSASILRFASECLERRR
jgi:hypothetical protein